MKQWFLPLLIMVAFTLTGCVGTRTTGEESLIPLAQAIREAAQNFINELAEGTSVSVLHFSSSSPDFNAHFIREMEQALSGKKLKVLENRELQEIREKINKEYGDLHLDDETVVSMTKHLGTQVVIIGELHYIDNTYRFYVHGVELETRIRVSPYTASLRPIGIVKGAGIQSQNPGPTNDPGPTPAPVPNNMVRINGETFTMGSPLNEPGRDSDEGPQRRVMVSDFYLGQYEVTQKEYQEVMGTNPSNFKGDNFPVERVSWFDAVEYCNRLSQRDGLTPAYTINGTNVTWNRNANGYRLPTEAEWEYACRAGTTTPFSTGNNITTSQANYDGNYPYNNNPKGEYRNRTTPVGSFAPNAWGLYDMHGNVWEWCWDWFGTYPSSSETNPAGASSGSYRVIRGGSWNNNAQNLRSANRNNNESSNRNNNVGFRLVRP